MQPSLLLPKKHLFTGLSDHLMNTEATTQTLDQNYPACYVIYANALESASCASLFTHSSPEFKSHQAHLISRSHTLLERAEQSGLENAVLSESPASNKNYLS